MNDREAEVDKYPPNIRVSASRMQRLYVELSKQVVELEDEAAKVTLRVHRGDNKKICEPAILAHVECEGLSRLRIVEQLGYLYDL